MFANRGAARRRRFNQIFAERNIAISFASPFAVSEYIRAEGTGRQTSDRQGDSPRGKNRLSALSSNPEIESQPSRANISSGRAFLARVDSTRALPAFFRGLPWFRRSPKNDGREREASGTLFSFRLRAGVEILDDNNASPVAPLISWKCNYEPGTGEARLRRWKEIRPRKRLSRRERWEEKEGERLLLLAELQWYK